MIDFVKGIVTGIVLAVMLGVIYFAFVISISAIFLKQLLLFLAILETFLLFWFVFRGNGKKIKVDLRYFLLGFVGVFILVTFLFFF